MFALRTISRGFKIGEFFEAIFTSLRGEQVNDTPQAVMLEVNPKAAFVL